jgi:hypothetical protein
MVSTPRLNRTVYSREPKLHTQVVTNRVINEKKKWENRDMIKYYSSSPKEVCGGNISVQPLSIHLSNILIGPK